MLITRVWKQQPGRFFFLCSKVRKRWQEHPFDSKSQRFEADVRDFIERNLDKDLYFCPHGFEKKRRLKDYAVMPKLLWADLDEADPKDMTPMPSIAWCSSPGRYCGLWITSSITNESLNRRLTYLIGADHGGWDITQVLRVPGTTNYKYPSAPRVRLLWQDGPEYALSEIEKLLPSEREAPASFGEAHKIFKRYEKAMTAFCRRELLGGKPRPGKRSEVIWRLNQELLEAGMTEDEVFVLLRTSPWNKFANRRNGDDQLRREIQKAQEHKLESEPVKPDDDRLSERYLLSSMAEVEEENIDWIWYPYLARREMTIIEGDPGLGKSYFAQIVGASICDGKKLPRRKVAHPVVQGKVAYFDMENSAGSITKRRLMDNGCEHLENYFQEERPFMIDDEDAIEDIYEALERIRPVLVVFDTINTYIGKADTHKAAETAQALAQFVEIAKRFDCSVVVIRHLTKDSKKAAIYRGQGSIGFTGTARVVITVGKHPEEDEENTLVAAVTKLNIARKPPAITFTIEALPDTLKHSDRSKFEWGDFVDLTSEEILSVGKIETKGGNKQEEVEEFLESFLSRGPMTKLEVERAANARGISFKMLLRVANKMGVVRESSGFGKTRKAHWSLPPGGSDEHSSAE